MLKPWPIQPKHGEPSELLPYHSTHQPPRPPPNAKHPAVVAGCGVDGLWVAEFAWGVALADEAFAGALVGDGVGHAVDGGAGWAVE